MCGYPHIAHEKTFTFYKLNLNLSFNRTLRKQNPRTRLNLECTSPTCNKHVSCKNTKQVRQNQNAFSWLSSYLLASLPNVCLLRAGLEQSRTDLVFEQPRFCNDFIFGMLCSFHLKISLYGPSRRPRGLRGGRVIHHGYVKILSS